VTGTSYGIIAPLTNGVTMIIDEAEFDAERWYRILANHKVNVWYTAPTAIRMLMKAGADLAKKQDLSKPAFHGERRRAAQSGSRGVGRGGPRQTVPRQLVADRNRRHHDRQLCLHAGQARLDGQADAGHRGGHRRAHGGRRAGNHQADGARRTGAAARLAVDDARLPARGGALQEGFPTAGTSRAISRCATATAISGSSAASDDVIKSAGHLIGPFEVESALIEHEAVAEAGRDRRAGRNRGRDRQGLRRPEARFDRFDEELKLSIQGHARKKLGPAVAPKEIEFRENLPKTRSGKIMRRLLKARELGLPEGDISTLESDEK
jgi:acetyl-CoA synthetase